MTDQALAPAGADTANAQTQAAVPEWMAGLPDELRSAVTAKGFKTPADVTQAWDHAQRAVGADKILAPKDGVWDASALEKLGVPKDPTGYKLNRPQLPEGVAYDENFEKAALPILHKMGIPPAGAQALLDFYAGHVAQQTQASTAAQRAAADEGIAALKTEFGAAFDERTQLAARAAKHFGGDGLIDALNKTGLGNHPDLVRAFAKIGGMMSEDTLKVGKSGGFALTPAEALAEANKIMSSEDYNHKDKAIRTLAVDKAAALMAQAYPETPAS